jgi:hypothetical protein
MLFSGFYLGFKNGTQKQMEKLNRGLVVVRTSSNQVFISWRLFGTDLSTIAFILYRGSTKITPVPLTDRTNFVDNTTINDIYTMNVVLDGVEQAYSKSASV